MISTVSTPSAASLPPVAGPLQPADGLQANDLQADDMRVGFLFRHSRQASRVHVLQHLVQRWRDQRAADGAVPAPRAMPPAAPAASATAAAARTLIDLGSLQQRIAQLPALPRAAAEALALLRDENSGADDCARVIGTDQALTARVLRLANSAFYGVPGRVGSVNRAVQMLGKRTLRGALTTVVLSGQFSAIQCEGFCFDGFWRHTIGTAIGAEAIARTCALDDETAFTAGVLHDIGRLALAAHFPRETAAMLELARTRDLPWLEAERLALGTDHAAVGAAIASHWRFPAAVQAAIAAHHVPQGSGRTAGMADVIHVADAIVHALDLAGEPGEAVPEIDAQAWQRVGLSAEQALELFTCIEQGVTALCAALAD
jgi:putative nucleotidyltransferase with HDIG domain